MERNYEKPKMEIILLSSDIECTITTSMTNGGVLDPDINAGNETEW